MSVPLGDVLVELCAGARGQVVLVAPFIKRATLERVLTVVPKDVPVRCITRWIPDEILAGVSDLAVWPLLEARGSARLALRQDLHAKYYRVDEECLVGSANLTQAALGWGTRPNLELLLHAEAHHPEFCALERELASALEVTEALYHEYERAVRALEALGPPAIVTGEFVDGPVLANQVGAPPARRVEAWLPTLRRPEFLFDAYRGSGARLTKVSGADALRDLHAFRLPPGLSEAAFRIHIRLQLLQMPLVQAVDKLVTEPQRFGAVRNFLQSQPCALDPDFNASAAWQTLMRWLLEFAGDRYVTWQANYSEIFCRRGP